MRLAPLILSISALAIPICAQSVATGAPPFSTMQSVPEGQINLANLNVHLVIPIVRKAGVGMPRSTSHRRLAAGVAPSDRAQRTARTASASFGLGVAIAADGSPSRSAPAIHSPG